MSGFLSPKYLKYQRASRTREITHDHYCRCCGYNVRGLNYGRDCPECGEQIEVPDASGGPGGAGSSAGGPLLRSSEAQRRHWRWGLALAVVVLITVVAARLALFIDLVFVGRSGIAAPYLIIGFVASVTWIVAVWLVTPADVGRPEHWRRSLRGLVRQSQFLWLAGYAAWALALGPMAGTGGEAAAHVVSLACRGFAGAGALGLAVLLQPVAKSAELDDAARRLNVAVWLLPVPSILLALVPGIVAWFTLTLIVMLMLLPWGWLMLVYIRGLLEMHRCVSWWLGHSAVSHTRTQRITQARAAADEQLGASVRPLPPQEPDLPLEPGSGENVRGETGGHAHGPHHRQ